MNEKQTIAIIEIMNKYAIHSLDISTAICVCYLDPDKTKEVAVHADGTEYWFDYERLHRLDGPAIRYPDGKLRWAIDDRYVNQKEHAAAVLKLKQGEVESE